jgi:hypothetical protein
VTITPSSQFVQQGGKLVGSGAVGDAAQGTSVALSSDGKTAIVGALDDDSGVGAGWVYTRSGGVWKLQGSKLVGSDYVGEARQGSSVALSSDGTTALVGGPSDNGSYPYSLGAAWVFVDVALTAGTYAPHADSHTSMVTARLSHRQKKSKQGNDDG